MSFLRSKHQATNKTVYSDNRLSTFTSPHIRFGDLHIERDETIGRNLTIGGDISANSFYASGNYYLNNYILIPYGTIIQSAAVNIPDGWFLCDGSTKSTNTYLNLYNAIGYTYGGSGDNFNLPDMRGRVAVGSGTGTGLTARTLGTTGGAETHMLTTDEMPSHSHSTNADGSTTARLVTVTGNNTASDGLDTTSGEPDLYSNTTLSISYTGGGQAHNNMQPFIVFNYLIKY